VKEHDEDSCPNCFQVFASQKVLQCYRGRSHWTVRTGAGIHFRRMWTLEPVI